MCVFCQVFTFTHPNCSASINNERYEKLLFEIPADTGSTLVHGISLNLYVTLFSLDNSIGQPKTTNSSEIAVYVFA